MCSVQRVDEYVPSIDCFCSVRYVEGFFQTYIFVVFNTFYSNTRSPNSTTKRKKYWTADSGQNETNSHIVCPPYRHHVYGYGIYVFFSSLFSYFIYFLLICFFSIHFIEQRVMQFISRFFVHFFFYLFSFLLYE